MAILEYDEISTNEAVAKVEINGLIHWRWRCGGKQKDFNLEEFETLKEFRKFILSDTIEPRKIEIGL